MRWSGGSCAGFGVDTICSAGTDLFSEMRLALAAERSRANAAALARGERVETVDLHQRDMLRLATLDGARVWNLDDEIGSLTPGKQADIAIVDMRSPHLDGFGDPVAVMVLGAGPADVETVIVGGDVVKRDGQLVGAHVKRAHQLMHETQDRLRRQGHAIDIAFLGLAGTGRGLAARVRAKRSRDDALEPIGLASRVRSAAAHPACRRQRSHHVSRPGRLRADDRDPRAAGRGLTFPGRHQAARSRGPRRAPRSPLRTASTLCDSRESAEDLVQDTVARVLSRPRLLPGGDERAYLMQALRNTFLTSRRTAARRPRCTTLEELDPADSRTGARPEEAMIAGQVFPAIAQLPESFRLALVAVDIAGLSYREAAQVLDAPEATITTGYTALASRWPAHNRETAMSISHTAARPGLEGVTAMGY